MGIKDWLYINLVLFFIDFIPEYIEVLAGYSVLKITFDPSFDIEKISSWFCEC
jgi:hypothetical protein